MPATDPKDAKRFLVIRLGAIGDALRVLPALRRIRRDRPGCHVAWLVEHWVYPSLAGHPGIDRFHIVDRRELRAGPRRAMREIRRVVEEARAEGYEVSLDFHGRFKSGLLAGLIRAPVRIGFSKQDATEANHLFSNYQVSLEDHWENRVLRFLHLLAPLGIDTSYDPDDLGLYVGPETRASAAKWYEEAGRPEICCFPGSSAGRARERWPETKWVELLGRLKKQGYRTVVLWGPAEEELARGIVEETGTGAVLAPPTTLPEMMALIGCFRAYVGSDTAAMHMAWMQGVPTATFIGPKPPRTVAPLAPVPSRVLRADEYYVEGVKPSKQDDEIVSAVPVGETLEAVVSLLGSSSVAGEVEGEA